MKIAYADPPYIGLSGFYRADPRCAEVDHMALIAQLEEYDAWALSLHSPAIFAIVPALAAVEVAAGRLTPPPDMRDPAYWPWCVAAMKHISKARGIRMAAWVKPFASFKPGINPAFAYEPVIFKPCKRKHKRSEPTVRDWVAASITLKRGLVGAKPEAFCLWLFDLLGMRSDDELTDLFPGTGVVGRTWDRWRCQLWNASEASA